MTFDMWLCLAIFIFMIAGYVFGSKFHISTGVVALTVIVMVMFSGIITPSTVIGYFGNSNVILIASMFIVTAGFRRTQAVKKVSGLVNKISGSSFSKMIALYCLMAFVLIPFTGSPVARVALMCPLVAASCEEMGVSPSKGIYPVFLVCLFCSTNIPIGSSATTFAVQNGYLESYGYAEYQMTILDPMKAKLPVAIVILLYCMFIAPKFTPDQPSNPIKAISSGNRKEKEVPPLDPVREVLGYSIFVLVVIGLIASSYIGLETYQVTMLGAALMLLTGVLTPKEGIANIPVQIILLVVAALSAGGAMMECGLGQLIGDTIAGALGGTHNGYIIGTVFFIIPFLLTQLMQNASVGNIFRPILILTCASLGCNPIGPLLLLNTAQMAAFLTPMATPSVPLAMDAGGYNQKDLLKMGWLPAIIIPLVSIPWVMTIFPAF